MLLGYNFPRIGKKCKKKKNKKKELGTRLTCFWHKNGKKISVNFIFVFEPLRFRHTCPSFLLSKFASQVKLIQSLGGGQLLVSGSQSPISRVPVIRVPCPRFASPKSQSPISWVPRSLVPGSQVLILNYAQIKYWCSFVQI